MRTGTQPAPSALRFLPTRYRPVLAAVLLAGMWPAGCDRAIVEAPTGQALAPWTTPFDREALEAAMPFHRADDLSGYKFALLMVVQNYNKAGVAVTLEVNGQSFERRYIAGLTQEVFEITNEMVQQTEAALGLSANAAEPRLGSQPCPFVVRLKQYVTEDGYVIQNTDTLLAPQNVFESMSTRDDLARDTSFLVDGHHVCPGAFAIVLRDTHVDVIELDREFIGLNEEGDDEDLVYDLEDPEGEPFDYHPETIDALGRLGLDWLLIGG